MLYPQRAGHGERPASARTPLGYRRSPRATGRAMRQPYTRRLRRRAAAGPEARHQGGRR
jgi:hypothetical protein